MTDALGLDVVPEHHPFWERGHRSVILTTTEFTTGGIKGGDAVTGFTSVKLKQRPHAGPIKQNFRSNPFEHGKALFHLPNAVLLPYAIWDMAAVG